MPGRYRIAANLARFRGINYSLLQRFMSPITIQAKRTRPHTLMLRTR
jgi:hypothetical protein